MTTSNLKKTVVCLASYFKGNEFIRECKRQDCNVILLTKEKFLSEDWPRESLNEIISVPNHATTYDFIYAVTQIARKSKIDLVVALEEFDVLTAALIREYLQISGLESTVAHRFRDKFIMCVKAKEAGIIVPDFVPILNFNEIEKYVTQVPSPWILKPRSDVSAIGIKKVNSAEELWKTIEEFDTKEILRERSPSYLLERYIEGDVYHVDSLVKKQKVIFAGVNRYGRPPMKIAHDGGVFVSYTIQHDSSEQKELLKINNKLIAGLGLIQGTTHAEFIKSREDGKFYFLEIAARVGGAYIAETLEASSGINLWKEWAKIELMDSKQKYNLPTTRKEYAGIVLSLAKQEIPDTSSYSDSEIVYRVKKHHHVGLVVRSKNFDRVQELLTQYAHRFETDFCAVQPPLERPE